MTLRGVLTYLGLGMIMAGITHWSLSLGLIVGGVAMIFAAKQAK